MFKTNRNTRNLHSALLLGAATAAIGFAAPAAAQDQTGGNVETVVVTGSRIPQTGLYSASPITAVGQQELKLTGTSDVVNLLDQLPAVFVGQNATSNNGSSGTASVNLRGLGSARTLVLVNGTRLAPGDPLFPFADINTIPAAMVDHIEVLTGGASAVYGSDAVAGVVNFIMRKDFEGAEFDGQYSVYQHNNNNGYAQGLYNAAGFTNPFTNAPLSAPNGSVWDGADVNGTAVLGANSANGKGNVTAFIDYRNSQPVLEGTRDFSACTMKDTAGPSGVPNTARYCAGSPNYSLFASVDASQAGASSFFFGEGNGKVGSGKFVPFTGAANQYFNYGALNYLQRNDTRWNGGFFAHYEQNKMLDIYSSFMFTDDKSTAQLAPSAAFFGTGPISGANLVNCDNPFLSQSENAQLCQWSLNGGVSHFITSGPIEQALGHPYWDGLGNLTPGFSQLYIGRRNIEGGNRTFTTEHESYRVQVGARGDLGAGWSYDVYGQRGYTTFSESDGGQLSTAKVTNALQVDPITGQCLSGAPGCVGLDVFNGFGGITPSMAAYIEVPSLTLGFTEEQIVSGNLTGDLGEWGLQSPWAKSPVAISVGSEYRQEALAIQPDAEGISGDLEGGSPVSPQHGRYDVAEGFTELKVPLVQGMPWVEDFTLNGGYRYSSYSTAGSTNTYKYGAEWQPIDDFRLRGSVQRAVRAPNVLELFTPATLGLVTSVQDPCSAEGAAGAGDKTVIANCEKAPGAANVPASYVGSKFLDCFASQCNGLLGGNIALKPEKSITHSLGAVLTPTFFDGFTATIDYFDIHVGDAIGTIPASTILQECYGDGATAGTQAYFCQFVNRSPNAHQITGTGYITQTEVNTGSLSTSGFDFEANYNADLNNWGMPNSGSLSFNLVGTLLDTLITEPVPGLGSYDCTGLYGSTCSGGNSQGPNPKWRHKFRVTWASPWDFSLSVSWRYFGEVNLDQNTTQVLLQGTPNPIEAHIPAFNWFDLAGEWNVSQAVSLRAGINNIFDKDPPITAIQPLPQGNANTYPGSYDSFGRTLFINGTVKF